jgi:hypothetical protein
MEVLHMVRNKLSALVFAGIIVGSFASLSGCSVNVKKEANGQDKQVDINTPVGGIHVSKQANVSDVGLTVYPGARMKENGAGRDKSANVSMSGFGYGLKVIALEYESDDSPSRVLAYYKDQLKKYGNVLECHYSGHLNVQTKRSESDSNDLTCDGNHGNNAELKVGRKDDQHIVAVEPQGTGSSFSLVYVRTHGRDADI